MSPNGATPGSGRIAFPVSDAGALEAGSVGPPRWGIPHVLALALVVALTATLVGPLRDLDLPWHLLIGQELVAERTLSGLGDAWSLYDPASAWVTSQWLSEVVLSAVWSAFGWSGIVALRAVLGLILLTGAAWLCFRWARPWVAVFVLAGSSVTLLTSIQERPNLATMIFAVWLAHAAWTLRRGGRAPRWWVLVLLVALWANLHGGWVLAPMAFALVGLAAWIEGDRRSRNQAFGSLALSIAAACFTPLGPSGLTLPLSFIGRTDHLAEWQRTDLLSGWSWGLLFCAVALTISWARRPRSTHWGDILIGGAWIGFGLVAFRNAAPAIILLLPLVAQTLDGAMPHRPRRRTDPVLIRVATTATAVAGVLLVAAAWVGLEPLSQYEPRGIGGRLDELSRSNDGERLRVLNEYNAAGPLLIDGSDAVALAIDGRADRFTPEWVAAIEDAHAARADVEDTLARVDPDAVVTSTDSPLSRLLRDRGWSVDRTDGEWDLLLPPDAGDRAP